MGEPTLPNHECNNIAVPTDVALKAIQLLAEAEFKAIDAARLLVSWPSRALVVVSAIDGLETARRVACGDLDPGERMGALLAALEAAITDREKGGSR